MPAPFDRGFNAAVLHIASRLFPTGYDVADKAPGSFDALKAHVARTGRMLVWSGASDDTIFADREVNWAFRAWHDWCHLSGGFDFTLAGETEAAKMQIEHVRALYGRRPDWERIIWAEVVGQATYFRDQGKFPAEQRAFTESYVRHMQRAEAWRAAA